jgi:hypothetical protein
MTAGSAVASVDHGLPPAALKVRRDQTPHAQHRALAPETARVTRNALPVCR